MKVFVFMNIFILAFFYLSFSFWHAGIDFTKWTSDFRLLYLFISISVCVFASLGYAQYLEDKK